MFTYEECRILSAVPIAEIRKYLDGLGAVEKPGQKYEYEGLTIEITASADNALPNLGIQRHTIDVTGNRALAEEFLNAFRLRFLSAGG